MPTPKLEDLEYAVLQLPQAERVLLVERLLASLEDEVESEAMHEWIALAETRADALDRGEAKTLDLESSLQTMRASLPE